VARRGRYLRAALRLWTDVTTRKMHVTGGVGAMAQEEMFGPAYFLPNDAYLETCAGVGMAQWGHEMTLAFGRSEFSDVYERAVYNNVLAGVSQDGSRFFYRNPLRSDGDEHRWQWHPCPCCPPMLIKQLGGLASHRYSTRGSTLYVHHFVGGESAVSLAGHVVRVRQSTRYPWDGRVALSIDLKAPMRLTLALRIPGWCDRWSVSVNGRASATLPGGTRLRQGYARVRRLWKPGDTVTLELDMPPFLVEANPYVEADRGRVAIQRGPVVYCLEETDNPEVDSIVLPRDPELKPRFVPSLFDGMVVVDGVAAGGRRFTAIPYFSWDNRSDGKRNRMAVWVPRPGTWDPARMVWAHAEDLDAWSGLLYRKCAP